MQIWLIKWVLTKHRGFKVMSGDKFFMARLSLQLGLSWRCQETFILKFNKLSWSKIQQLESAFYAWWFVSLVFKIFLTLMKLLRYFLLVNYSSQCMKTYPTLTITISYRSMCGPWRGSKSSSLHKYPVLSSVFVLSTFHSPNHLPFPARDLTVP